MPRLLMRMSASGTAAVRAFAPFLVRRSAARPCSLLFGTAALICEIASRTRASVRTLTMTVAPDSASPCAIANPMPAVEPVTIAVFPSRRISMCAFLLKVFGCSKFEVLFNKHAIAVREKPVLLFDGVVVRLQDFLSTRKGRYQHEQRGFRKMKIRQQRTDHP